MCKNNLSITFIVASDLQWLSRSYIIEGKIFRSFGCRSWNRGFPIKINLIFTIKLKVKIKVTIGFLVESLIWPLSQTPDAKKYNNLNNLQLKVEGHLDLWPEYMFGRKISRSFDWHFIMKNSIMNQKWRFSLKKRKFALKWPCQTSWRSKVRLPLDFSLKITTEMTLTSTEFGKCWELRGCPRTFLVSLYIATQFEIITCFWSLLFLLEQ